MRIRRKHVVYAVIALQRNAQLLEVVLHELRRDASRAACTAGSNSATRMPMMAITTSSSTSVNAGFRFITIREKRPARSKS